MKKFIFTINIAALLALVPAVFIGYLHNDASTGANNASTETVKDTNNGAEDATTIHLVKTF